MDTIYSLMNALLPFAWAQATFMKHAFLAMLFVTPLFGILSTMVVSNRMAFFSDSLGHGAFSGIAVGVLFGSASPLLSLIVFSALFALVITWIKNKGAASTDTIIGVFSATAIAIGLMLLSRGGSFNQYSTYLIGDILAIKPADIAVLAVLFLVVLVLWGVLFNRLLVLSLNASFAKSRGIRGLAVESAFAVMLAVVVAISIQWVGILIINALLVLPAAAARNVAGSVKSYHAISVSVALFSGITGLILAYYANMAAGATIVAVAAGLFFLTLAVRARLRK